MRKKYIFLFSLFFILLSCPSPSFDYVILKNGQAKKGYAVIYNNIKMNFSGQYRWIAGVSIYTTIAIEINNESNNNLIVDRQNMIIDSKYFHYKNHTDNKITVPSKSVNTIMLEYSSKIPYTIISDSLKLPKDEMLTLIPNGFEINGEILKVEKIYFKPEEIQEN